MLAQFSGPEVHWFALSPLLVLTGAAIILLVAGALTPTWPKGCYGGVTALSAVAAGVLAAMNWDDISDGGPRTLVGGAMALDVGAMFITITICIGIGLVALVLDDFVRPNDLDGPELYALTLVAGVGAIVMGSANDLIVLFLGLETMSLAFYILASSQRVKAQSQESGLKYFLLGGFASAFLLYGIALIYGSVGSTNFSEIRATLAGTIRLDSNEALMLAGIALMIVGLAFKVAAAPFHLWTPDVYQGAPTPVTGLMASVGKAAAFAAFVRVLVLTLPAYRDDWRPMVWALAVTTLLAGAVLAVVQTNVKRMLAYSSINHAGFVLVGLEAAAHTAGTSHAGAGVPSIYVYLITYSVLVVGSFAAVGVVAGARDRDTDLGAFRGLGRRRPVVAIALTVFLLAQAGVPFTSGFVAKFGVIRAAVDQGSYVLGVIAMLTAVIAAFLYLRIMAATWLGDDDAAAPAPASVSESVSASEPASGSRPFPVGIPTGCALGLAALFTLAVGIYPSWLLDLAEHTVDFVR